MKTDFSSLALSPDLLAVISELGFDKMTPIQAESIPPLLQGKDLIGQSKTGSGKTAAFALPIFTKNHYAQPLPRFTSFDSMSDARTLYASGA